MHVAPKKNHVSHPQRDNHCIISGGEKGRESGEGETTCPWVQQHGGMALCNGKCVMRVKPRRGGFMQLLITDRGPTVIKVGL